MHLACWLPAGLSAGNLAALAAARGLHLSSISRFALRPLGRDGVLFGFSGAPPDQLRAGVRTLAEALREGEA